MSLLNGPKNEPDRPSEGSSVEQSPKSSKATCFETTPSREEEEEEEVGHPLESLPPLLTPPYSVPQSVSTSTNASPTRMNSISFSVDSVELASQLAAVARKESKIAAFPADLALLS